MCNLYSATTNREAIRALARAMRENAGNMPPLPGIFPDYLAPIVRTGADGVRELVRTRWGMPSPAFTLLGKKVDKGVTNVRNTASPHLRRWLSPASRCVVPFTSFSEPTRLPDGRSVPVWFALGASRPLAFFAGIWTTWTCTRKVAEGEVMCDLYAFPTTEPNAEVAAIHPKAMPAILTTADEIEAWLSAPWGSVQPAAAVAGWCPQDRGAWAEAGSHRKDRCIRRCLDLRRCGNEPGHGGYRDL